MFKSILIGIFAVAVISWAMGAYNRLVRLRAATSQAFAALQLTLKRQSENFESLVDDELADQLQNNQVELMLCKDVYAVAVQQYNDAMTQVPAAWLAALFCFKPVKCDEGTH